MDCGTEAQTTSLEGTENEYLDLRELTSDQTEVGLAQDVREG